MILNIRQHAYVGHPQSVSLGSFISGIEFLSEMMEQDLDMNGTDTGSIDSKSQIGGIIPQRESSIEVPTSVGA